jgi:hypothetical protein
MCRLPRFIQSALIGLTIPSSGSLWQSAFGRHFILGQTRPTANCRFAQMLGFVSKVRCPINFQYEIDSTEITRVGRRSKIYRITVD